MRSDEERDGDRGVGRVTALEKDSALDLAARLGREDYTEGERVIIAELAAVEARQTSIETKIDAMLGVFEQLSKMMEQFQGKSLLDVLRGKG